MSPNHKAFLDMIAYAEIGPKLLKLSDNGYNVLVGSTPAKPLLFSDYGFHPRIYNREMNSDAAGRYQFMGRYWAHYKQQLALPDFGPDSQDRWALQLIKECRAFDDIALGYIEKAVAKCRSRWASFPGAGYNQPEKDMASMMTAFNSARAAYA